MILMRHVQHARIYLNIYNDTDAARAACTMGDIDMQEQRLERGAVLETAGEDEREKKDDVPRERKKYTQEKA